MTNVIDSGTNLLSSRTDALGRTTAFEYDSLGNMTEMTLLHGTGNAVTWTYTYDPVHNQVASVTGPLNHTTSFEYDDTGNLIRVTDPLEHVTEMTYTYTGQLESVTDPLNHTTTLSYYGTVLTGGSLPAIPVVVTRNSIGGIIIAGMEALGVMTNVGSKLPSLTTVPASQAARTAAQSARQAAATRETDTTNNPYEIPAYEMQRRIERDLRVKFAKTLRSICSVR